jgi:hypothetical protein
MLLPIGTAFARPIELGTSVVATIETWTVAIWPFTTRTILARARKTRTRLATAIIAWSVITWSAIARLVETPRAVAGWSRIATGIISHLPRLCVAAIFRVAVGAAAEFFPWAAGKFLVAIARRAVPIGPITARRIWALVTELLLAKARRRTAVAIP